MKLLIRAIIICGLLLACQIKGVVQAQERLSDERVKIAILDSGCNVNYKEGISLIDRTIRDYNGHGTLMAKIIKEEAYLSDLYIVKVVDKNGLCPNEEAVIYGIEWAISRGVDLINMSLRIKHSERLYNAISKAYKKGIVILAAAGNSASRVDLQQNKGGFNLEEVAYPAKYEEVIAVGGFNRNGKIYGHTIMGKEVEAVCRGYKGAYEGTSVASAFATGIIARMISEKPHVYLAQTTNQDRVKEIRRLIHFRHNTHLNSPTFLE